MRLGSPEGLRDGRDEQCRRCQLVGSKVPRRVSMDKLESAKNSTRFYLQTIHRPTVSSPNTTIAMIPTFFGDSPDEIDSNKNN